MDKSAAETLLIVDDEEINRAILANIFSREYNIMEAGDGLSALELIRERQDSLSAVLLDVIMPGLNGLELLACTDDLYGSPDGAGASGAELPAGAAPSFAGDGTASCVPADLKSAATAVQTFYEGIFLEQGYPITYMAFRIDHDGPFSAPRDPDDFDSDYWRSVEGPRLLFGRDTAETRRQKLKK